MLEIEFAILLTLILEYEESDELIGDPTSNFCCDGEESFEFSFSITLLVADDETFLRTFAPPLLLNLNKIEYFQLRFKMMQWLLEYPNYLNNVQLYRFRLHNAVSDKTS